MYDLVMLSNSLIMTKIERNISDLWQILNIKYNLE